MHMLLSNTNFCKHDMGEAAHWAAFLMILIVFCIYEYGIQKICGFTMYPDEFGYWASAASAVGYDWSEAASLGSYYSFGYSLILIPVLKVFSDGVMAYRAAIFINMLLMCVSVFLFGKLIDKIFPGTKTGIRVLVSGAAVLYPAWIFYMQMSMAEAVLIFLFSFIVYLFHRFMEKQTLSNAIALAAVLIYSYSVHMRTVGVVIACVIVCLYRLIREKGDKKILFLWLGAVALLLGLAFCLKERTIATVYSYAEQDVLAVNDYSSQWRKVAAIFTFDGMNKFVWSVLGKLYYLGISSFGTFYWAIGWCVKESIPLFRRRIGREDNKPGQWLALFVLLAVTGQVLISSIYMYNPGNIDGLVYGRYNELFVPVTIMIGIMVMSRSRFLVPVTVLIGMVLGGNTFLLLHVIEQGDMSGIRGYHVPGISYLLPENITDVQAYFWHTWLLGFGLILFVCIFVWLGRQRTSTWWLFTGILVIEIAAGLQISNHYTYQVNSINFENLMIAELLQEKKIEDTSIIYLEEGFSPFVDFLQMQIPEETIHVIRDNELSSTDGKNYIVITDAETEQDEVLKKKFDKNISTNLFCLYYN